MSYFDFFHADRHTNNKKINGKSFHVSYNYSQCMEKMTKTRNGEKQIFQKLYQSHFLSFGFWILWISVLKNLLALTLPLRWPNLLVFLFWNLCVLDKLRHCFLQIHKDHKDIWKQLKTIIIIVVKIVVDAIEIFIIISVL